MFRGYFFFLFFSFCNFAEVIPLELLEWIVRSRDALRTVTIQLWINWSYLAVLLLPIVQEVRGKCTTANDDGNNNRRQREGRIEQWNGNCCTNTVWLSMMCFVLSRVIGDTGGWWWWWWCHRVSYSLSSRMQRYIRIYSFGTHST